jgi:hypothetical protein
MQGLDEIAGATADVLAQSPRDRQRRCDTDERGGKFLDLRGCQGTEGDGVVAVLGK